MLTASKKPLPAGKIFFKKGDHTATKLTFPPTCHNHPIIVVSSSLSHPFCIIIIAIMMKGEGAVRE